MTVSSSNRPTAARRVIGGSFGIRSRWPGYYLECRGRSIVGGVILNGARLASPIAWVLLSCAVLMVAGCDLHTPEPVPSTPPPKQDPIQLEVVNGDTFNFGTMELGQEFQHVFIIKNVDREKITLKDGPPSCSTCTFFEIDKTEIEPGETAKATVKWKIKVENPEFRQHAPILAARGNKMPEPLLKLFVEGRVSKRIVISPLEKWNLGILKEGRETEYVGTVTSPTLDSFEVVSAISPNPKLEVKPRPMSAEKLTELKAKSGYELVAVVQPGVPVGDFSERVTLNLKVPDEQHFYIDLEGRRSGPLQIFGPNWTSDLMLLNLPPFDLKDGTVARLNLFTMGIADQLAFESVTCPDDRFSVELVPDAKLKANGGNRRRYELFVRVAPTDRAVVYTLQQPLVIQIKTNQAQIGTINLKIRSSALK